MKTKCKNCGCEISQTKGKQKFWLHYLNGLLQLKYVKGRGQGHNSICECGCNSPEPKPKNVKHR